MQQKDLAERLNELRKKLHERTGEHDTQLADNYDAFENLPNEKTERKTGKIETGLGTVEHMTDPTLRYSLLY